MIYNTSNPYEKKKFYAKALEIMQKGAIAELKKPRLKRTLSQNAYLHVLFTLYGVEFGYTLEEAKKLVKETCPFNTYEKNGHKFARETSKFTTEEMTEFIEWFRTWSAQNGCYLPSSEEYLEHQVEINKEIEQNKQFINN